MPTTTPATPSDLESVATLLPAFEFECLIAHGNSGSVYKARHRSLDRDVAIKVIPRGSGDDQSSGISAKAMANLNHPNLIRVYDSGEAGDFFYSVMEFVPGKSLAHSSRGKAIDPQQASEIIIAACEGLAHAHASGVIHGGITPSDILLNQKCEPKIGNFGTSQNDENTDAQTDVFELGLILRELLTGVSRESSDAASAMVPDMRLAMICRKATHLDPERRYSDVSAFSAAISSAIIPVDRIPAVRKQQVAPAPRPKPALAVSSSNHGYALFGKCAVIAFLLFSIYGIWGLRETKQQRLVGLQLEEVTEPKLFAVQAAQTRLHFGSI